LIPTAFTPVASLFGGALIGLTAIGMMLFYGRIAGISSIASRLLPPYQDREFINRLAFIAGLVLAPTFYMLAAGQSPPMHLQADVPTLVVAGLAVGFGTVWGNGCTSGHGICGLSRLSPRSAVAVAIFMTTAIVTVFIARHVL
jgi:uncharacterized membrane protein YedE/YeeE